MGVGGETACDMTQGVRAILREDVLGDPTAKCLAEISDRIGSKLAEPAPHVPTREEYRMWAEICVNWARELGRDQRRNCLTLARAYLRAAMSEEAVQSNFSPMLPVVAPGNELLLDCKTHSTLEGLQNVQYEPREFQLYSAGSRGQSAKRISRGSLRIAILALTIGATTGVGAVLALVSALHQYTAYCHCPPSSDNYPTSC
jgi:hypothetical protein